MHRLFCARSRRHVRVIEATFHVRRTNLIVKIMIFIVLRVTLTGSVPIHTQKLIFISLQYGGGVEFLAK